MAFAGIHTLQRMSLIDTGLSSMPPLTPVKNTLRNLCLDHNNISYVPPGYFLGFNKLGTLSMNSNLLLEVPDVYPLLNTITKLFLNTNHVLSISGGLNGTTYPLMRYISLAGNAITMFDSDMMSFWPLLKLLILSGNRIVYLPTSYPKNDEQRCPEGRTDLHFVRNPIHCDGAVEGIITRRIDGHHYVDWNPCVRISELSFTVCASPSYLCGRNLVELSKWNTEPWCVRREQKRKRGPVSERESESENESEIYFT